MRSTIAAFIALLAAACGGTSPVSPTPPAATAPLGRTNVGGEWRGVLAAGACDPGAVAQGLCSPAVVFPWTRGLRITLTQNGSAIAAFIQGDIAEGHLTGAVDGLGRVSLAGTVSTLTVGSGQSPGRPYLRFTRWRTVVDQTSGQLVGDIAYRILDANGNESAAEYVNQLQLPRCDAPGFTGVYWEC